MLPENDPASPAQKPGWKTTEFWLSFAAIIVGALLASDLITNNAIVQALGVVASILGALGYQVQRGYVKASGNKAAAFVEAAKVAPPANPPKL